MYCVVIEFGEGNQKKLREERIKKNVTFYTPADDHYFSLVELMIGILNSIRSFLKSKSAQDESELNNSGVEKNKKRKVSGL